MEVTSKFYPAQRAVTVTAASSGDETRYSSDTSRVSGGSGDSCRRTHTVLESLPEESPCNITSRVTQSSAIGEPKYRLGSMIVCENRKMLGEFAWKNRSPICVKRNWGSLFQEDESTIFSGVNSQRQSTIVTAESMVEKVTPKEPSSVSRFKSDTVTPGSLTAMPPGNLRPGFLQKSKQANVSLENMIRFGQKPKSVENARAKSLQSLLGREQKSTVIYRLSDASERSSVESTPPPKISSLNVTAPCFVPDVSVVGTSVRGSFTHSTPESSPTESMYGVHNVAFFHDYVRQKKAAIFASSDDFARLSDQPTYDNHWTHQQDLYHRPMEMYGPTHFAGHFPWQMAESSGYGQTCVGMETQQRQQNGWNMRLDPPVTVQSVVIPTVILDDASTSPARPVTHADMSPASDEQQGNSVALSWTVVLVDENAFKESQDFKDAVQRRLTSVRMKTFKSAAKCWRALEKKSRLDKYVIIVNASEAAHLANLLLTKKFSPPMIVFDGTPDMPIPCRYCDNASVVDQVVNITGCVARDEATLEGVNFTLLWVDEQVFKAHGQARKQDLEFLKSCIGVKTYKSADKCVRALGKKQRFDSLAVLVGEDEANDLLAYLCSRSERVPVVVELSDSSSNWQLKAKYDKNLILTTNGHEDTCQRLSDFVFRTISRDTK